MRIALSVQAEFVIVFNLNYGIYYLMVKMALIINLYRSLKRQIMSHEIRLNDDIYRYFKVSLSITSEA